MTPGGESRTKDSAVALSGAAEAVCLSSTDDAAATTALRVAFMPCPRLGLRLLACTHGQSEPTWLIGLLLTLHARGTDCCPRFDAAVRKSNSWRPPPQLEGAASGTAGRCCRECSRIARYGQHARDWLHRTYPKVAADSHLEQTRRLNNLTTCTTTAHKHKTRVLYLQQGLRVPFVFLAQPHLANILEEIIGVQQDQHTECVGAIPMQPLASCQSAVAVTAGAPSPRSSTLVFLPTSRAWSSASNSSDARSYLQITITA